MKILLQSVKIIEHKQKASLVNLLIEDGIIKRITDQPIDADLMLATNDLHVSAGWVDFGAFLADPGFEYKEDIRSGVLAASAGGYTEVVCLPNTYPILQDKNSISYYISGNKNRLVQLHPLGAITVKNQGIDLTEMLDMHEAGAVAFSDGLKPLTNPDIILKTLQYLTKVNSLLINRPSESALSHSGVAHEGVVSTMLGLKGIPSLAEEIAIIRDLELLKYAGGKIHFSNISSARSVELIREAKRQGLAVTCDIAAHQIAFDDSVLNGFDTNIKVDPPYRSKNDIAALWNGLKDGTIDIIASAHNPQDEESKKLEFDLAEFGSIGLETSFAVINTHNKVLTTDELIEKLAINPRKALGREIPEIREGLPANLTVFDPTIEWTYHERDVKSKSKNSPFINSSFKGQAVAAFNNGFQFINDHFKKAVNNK